ncbi:hypothetical protein NQ318_015021 [Aromia moschata]|uniref:Transmembrane protein 64 n=1 Tax=Aromia moschata TaxID=1265417 RepID=A0AAV8YYT8_9CUCU|nr:hypothetical protein NQ318_015021 [Aromia moschata]
MKINIGDFDEKLEQQKDKCGRLRSTICFLSLCRLLALICTLFVILCILLLCKAYIKFVLLWLENQDKFIISGTICFLYILVSLPVSIGYIVLVVASGYLFGIGRGLMLTVFGANFGLLVAHNILRYVGHHPSVYRYTRNDTAQAIMRVISGPLCFKIVFCSRLTPIPFGLQNTIFAQRQWWHLPLGFVAGTVPRPVRGGLRGSTLRSMQDVLESRHISSTTYFFFTLQLMLGASLMVWLGAKARRELLKAIAEAETKVTSFPV